MHKEFTNVQYGNIRTAIIDKEPYFCLKDVCKILDIRNVSECRGKLDEEGIKIKEILSGSCLTKMLFITAENLSGCLFQSKMADAEIVCDWLYLVVLPQLNSYVDHNVDEYLDPDRVIQLIDNVTDLKVKNEIMTTNQKLNEPKLRVLNKLLGTPHCVDLEMITLVIKYRNINPTELLKILRGHHVLDEANMPFQEYCDRRYFRIVEAKSTVGNHTLTCHRTFVYQSGVSFIEKILKNHEGGRHARNND
jgi:anti-repressor protein